MGEIRQQESVNALARTIRFLLDLNALGHPTWLAVAAETRRDITLDHSAWYLIYLE